MRLEEIPVTTLKGIGVERAKDLSTMGIQTIADLLLYFPYRYEDYRLIPLTEASDGERITIRGKLLAQPSLAWFGAKKSRLVAQAEVDRLKILIIWYNQPFLKKQLIPGKTMVVVGKWDSRRMQLVAERTFMHPKEQEQVLGRLTPVYSVAGSIKVNWLRKKIYEAFTQYGREIKEILPEDLVQRYRLMDRARAMYYLHFPRNIKEGQLARRRMVYEECFLHELRWAIHRQQMRQRQKGISHQFDQDQLEAWISRLPFTLTAAQRRVIDEILADLKRLGPMNRLLQGDVGSGKTVVAAAALYANYLSGYQGALMVPTEILAEQHFRSLNELLTYEEIKIVMLTGSCSNRQRKELLAMIAAGEADVIVGTQALIQEGIQFAKLGLVITDEQHRFGVKQRAMLREKGHAPDVLSMTATPIPRTLAITLYGDMDVSVIDELPAGREPVATYWVKPNLWPRVMEHIRKECEAGHQVYIICPLIEESEKLDLENAYAVYEQLTKELAPIRVGLLHGKLAPAEKEEVMRCFVEGTVQVLVSTTVVEVGVNVPRATLMVIYDADRFGLAQLHQLRGRVGRGGGAATCILVADPKSENGIERMRVMTETNDGFEIARRDLELRGPGEFFGVRQSGLPEFRLADLVRDQAVFAAARNDVAQLVQKEDFWERSELRWLHEWLRDIKIGSTNFD